MEKESSSHSIVVNNDVIGNIYSDGSYDYISTQVPTCRRLHQSKALIQQRRAYNKEQNKIKREERKQQQA